MAFFVGVIYVSWNWKIDIYLVSFSLFPRLSYFSQLPKSMTKPTINVVKAIKVAPTKKVLAPTKNNDDYDDDDDGQSFDVILHNIYI